MSSIIANITQAVVDELNDHDFGTPFAAKRHYAPAYEVKDIKDLTVTVVPAAIEHELASRESTACEFKVDIAVQKKLDSQDAATVDPLLELVQLIRERFDCRNVLPGVSWVKTTNEPVYSPEYMHRRVFTSVVTLTYRFYTTVNGN